MNKSLQCALKLHIIKNSLDINVLERTDELFEEIQIILDSSISNIIESLLITYNNIELHYYEHENIKQLLINIFSVLPPSHLHIPNIPEELLKYKTPHRFDAIKCDKKQHLIQLILNLDEPGNINIFNLKYNLIHALVNDINYIEKFIEFIVDYQGKSTGRLNILKYFLTADFISANVLKNVMDQLYEDREDDKEHMFTYENPLVINKEMDNLIKRKIHRWKSKKKMILFRKNRITQRRKLHSSHKKRRLGDMKPFAGAAAAGYE